MEKESRQTADEFCEKRPDEEFSVIDSWLAIWRRRKMIFWMALAAALLTAALSLFMTNIYQARTVIMPVASRESAGGSAGAMLAQQLGMLPGIAMPGSATAAEIVNLLRSNILREKMIRQYNLMPVLFHEQWDARGRTWKERPGFFANGGAQKKAAEAPTMWDALRLLENMVEISRDAKENTIALSVDFHDPEAAARIAEYFLAMVTNHMSSEAKRVAATNRKYLEEQLGSTSDPFIRQKTYNMIAQQIEMGMMAEVKENFAFKVIDPPLAPDRKIKPRRTLMVMLSLGTTLLIGIFLAFFLDCLEKVRAKRREVGT